MYRANVYRVMIASPSDVPNERKIAREVINEWNTLHSSHRNIVLLSLLWEYNTVPASGQRAQGIINDQLLKHADLLVGIFWKRIGSNTGKAISGTVEELETHVNNGKPAMLYFSDAHLPQDFDREQYDALQLEVTSMELEIARHSSLSYIKEYATEELDMEPVDANILYLPISDSSESP